MTTIISVSAALLLALHGAECDLKTNPPPGDGGKALGVLQIRQEVIDDVNRIYKTKYVHTDALNKTKAFEICKLYLKHWGARYRKETGLAPTDEVLARIWNGGPKGWKKTATVKYWVIRVTPYINKKIT